MFDLNKIVTDALTAAVAEAIRPLSNRIDELENLLLHRLEKVENNPAIGTDTTLEQRVVALEERPATAVAGVITPEMIVESMNKAEWLWEKVNAYIETGIEDRIERAIDDHCETYNHDDYDNVVSNWNDEDPTEFVREGDLSSQINDVLNGASFDVRISI
jgi:hypothetical protein